MSATGKFYSRDEGVQARGYARGLSYSYTHFAINQPFHDNAQGINYLQASFVRAIQQPLGIINPLMTTLKPQSNGPSYSNIVIGTLAVDGWAVTFGAARRSWTGPQPAQTTARCTKCNSPPINGQCTNFVLFDVAL